MLDEIKGGWIITFIVLIVLVALGLNSYHVTPVGHVATVTTLGTMSDTELNPGFNFVLPWSNVDDIDVREITLPETQEAETSDTQTIKVSVVVNLHPDSTKVCELIKSVGPNFLTTVVDPATKEAVKAEISKHKVTDIVKNRQEIKESIISHLTKRLSPYNIIIVNATISNIDFSDKYDNAIEAKQVEEQRAGQRIYELQARQTEAEMAKAKAKGEADSAIEAARGQAESVRLAATAEAQALQIRAEAQSDYNKRVSESLTPLLVQRQMVDKWSGTLPVYMMGSTNPMMLMNLPVTK